MTAAALVDAAGAPAEPAGGIAARVADQERFCADLAAGSLAAGPAGTVVAVTDRRDLLRRHHELAAVVALARDLADQGFGVRLATVAAAPAVLAAMPAAGPARPVAVVATSPAFDPSAVPAGVRCSAWVLGALDGWADARRLAVYDAVLAASPIAAERVARRTGVRVGTLPVRPDTRVFTRPPSAAGPDRVLVTVVAARSVPPVLVTALVPFLRAGTLRVHVPRSGVPDALRAAARPPLRAADRPGAFAASVAVVFADADPAAIAAGIIDAAVSEAAAAGAVPCVRSGLGLLEAEVAEARAAPTTAAMRTALADLARQPGEARAAGARMAARLAAGGRAPAVRDRLAALVELPAAVRPAAGVTAPARDRTTLGWFPDLSRSNPYQPMLYRRLQSDGVRVAPVSDALDRAVLRDDGGRLDHYVFHLHWTSIVVQDGTSVFDAAGRLRRFTDRVEDLVARGGRLVWTVHNVLSHDVRYRDLEIELCRYLARTAALVHVLGLETVAAAAPWYTIDPSRLAVVPHSSYRGEYPDWMTREQARARLGYRPGEVVLLAAGGIRPYRGLDRLLDVFGRLAATDPRLRLLVAGRPGREPEVARWLDRARADPRITLRAGHVADAELQVLHRAADVAVLPYRAILNSGSFLLGQTFGLPVVGPRAGSLAALVDRPGALGFDPADDAGLLRAVAAAVDLVGDPVAGPAARAAAAAAARANSPAAMADGFAAALRDHGVLGAGRPAS